jgi:CRP-like cAMP-binding protein
MRTKAFYEILAAHPVFKDFDTETLDLLAGCARNEVYKAGRKIFVEGDAADKAFILRKGDVAMEISSPQTAPLTIETLHDGDIFGWSWMVPPYVHMSDARAITEVRVISLDATCLRGKCDANPALGYEMFKHWLPLIVRRIRTMRMQLLDLYGTRKG